MKIFLVLLCLVITAVAGVFGWLYYQEDSQSNRDAVTALVQIASLRGTIDELQGQLRDEKANATIMNSNLTAEKGISANLSTQLAAEKTKSAGLENQLAAGTGDKNTLESRFLQMQKDLDASKVLVTKLTNDLSASVARVTVLEKDLTAVQGTAAKLQASLNDANSGLAGAVAQADALKASNNTLTAELKKIKDPRHFISLEELTTWLAKDDTNTNPSYTGLTLSEKAFILQVKALRDGYLMPVGLDADSLYIYSWNSAVVSGILYIVNANDDTITQLGSFTVLPAVHPMPLG
jgi:predicted  nucleic acid-binding Zn-ribbon protein